MCLSGSLLDGILSEEMAVTVTNAILVKWRSDNVDMGIHLECEESSTNTSVTNLSYSNEDTNKQGYYLKGSSVETISQNVRQDDQAKKRNSYAIHRYTLVGISCLAMLSLSLCVLLLYFY